MTEIKDRLSAILEEIAPYEVQLEDDPTRPELGVRYLQKMVADCRKYQNRVSYYYQEVSREERKLRLELKAAELDLEFKTKEKLADDPTVRKQPSISDREALAATMLRDEHVRVAGLRVDLLDIQETINLIKFKHGELQRTSQDIKMQRGLVKDDAAMRLSGQEGYTSPVINQDKTVAGGLPAPIINDDLNPVDLLNPDKRPEYTPAPVDSKHAQMIADFFNGSSSNSVAVKNATLEENIRSVSYEDLLS